MSPTDADGARQLIASDFDVTLPERGDSPEASWLHAIRAALTDRLLHLLNNDLEKLMHTLYRIDVGEAKVAAVFRNEFPPDIPEKLADLIIDREFEKVRTRARHRTAGEGMEVPRLPDSD